MRSMTGYGKASISKGGVTIVCECRSLNSKNLDLNLKLPSSFREIEGDVRKLMNTNLIRGKVDVGYSVERSQEETPLVVNEPLFNAYLKQLQELSKQHSLNDANLMQFILKMPEVMSSDKSELSEEGLGALLEVTKEAVDNLNSFRDKEGEALSKELLARIVNIENSLEEITKKDPGRISSIRDRIQQKLEELSGLELDQGRLEQEMIYYIEKLDITEEKVRLKTHCDHFRSTMSDVGSGRKLGFIAQEIGREINTIGSKANDANIQKLVVQMKDELEKIKEQVLNVL